MTLRRCTELTSEVAALLTLAMYPDPARVRSTLEHYASDPSLQVWAWMKDRIPACAAGLRVQGEEAALLHVGTLPEARRQGVGRSLLNGLMAELHLEQLVAETDDGAVGFYRRCGFEVTATAANGAVARFRCTLRAGSRGF